MHVFDIRTLELTKENQGNHSSHNLCFATTDNGLALSEYPRHTLKFANSSAPEDHGNELDEWRPPHKYSAKSFTTAKKFCGISKTKQVSIRFVVLSYLLPVGSLQIHQYRYPLNHIETSGITAMP